MNLIVFNAESLNSNEILNGVYKHYPENSRLIVIAQDCESVLRVDGKDVMVFPSINAQLDRIRYNPDTNEGYGVPKGNPLMPNPDAIIYKDPFGESDRIKELIALMQKGYPCVAVFEGCSSEKAAEMLTRDFPDVLADRLVHSCTFIDGHDLVG